MKRSALMMACLMSFSSFTSHAALDPNQPLADAPPYSLFVDWAKPVKPFRIAESVWYVGTENLSSVLIATPQGHVLIDGALDASAAQIRQNIRALGFHVADIRLILNSHARLDQAGGIARIKAWSGAKLVASRPNAEQMARGGKDDFALGDALPFPPVKTDILVEDGDVLRLGDVTIKALLTPGHLPGSTSWLVTLADGKTMIYADSLATPGYDLVDNKNYPTLTEDIERSFRILAAQHVDIFVANKGERFDLAGKMARLAAGDKEAFIDREGLQRYVAQSQQRFAAQLKEQTAR